MRRIKFGGEDSKKRRLVVIFRSVGKPLRSKSETLYLDEDEPTPKLGEMLERAVNAIVGGSREHS